MYKKILALLPAVAATIWIAATAEQEYTEPTLITGAAYLPGTAAAIAETVDAADMISVTEITAVSETIAVPETTAVPETIAIPETTAVPETIAIPETTAVPETIAIPETTVVPETMTVPGPAAAPETSIVPETSAVPETTAAAELQENVVYWVKNGEVWHLSVNCSSLSRSKSILSGTVDAAMDAGKARVCKRCSS